MAIAFLILDEAVSALQRINSEKLRIEIGLGSMPGCPMVTMMATRANFPWVPFDRQAAVFLLSPSRRQPRVTAEFARHKNPGQPSTIKVAFAVHWRLKIGRIDELS